MAARSGSGNGALVSALIFGLLTVALFVTTVVFFSQKGAADRKLKDAEESNRQIIRENERNSDVVQRIKNEATKDKKSVVGYLLDANQQTMELASGASSGTVDDLKKTFGRLGIPTSKSLVSEIRSLKTQLETEKQARKTAEDNRDAALKDKEAEVQRVQAIQKSQDDTINSLNADIEQMRNEVDQYRGEINTAKQDMYDKLHKAENSFHEREADLQSQIDKSKRDLLLANDTVRRLQSELRGQRVQGASEEALVDGRVIGLDPTGGNVYINVGKHQKAVLGMRFELYSDATAIRPDPQTGDYPAGKATLEIINVDANSSTARIIREKKGNPIVKGDVIANAIYDPNKVYTMLVYGNFDTDGDGQATQREALDIKAGIEAWGGKVVDELSGNVDYLVLGEKPVLPPKPPIDAPTAVIQEYIRLERIANRYDDLFNKAVATSIPVLNENRLYTLTGHIEAR